MRRLAALLLLLLAAAAPAQNRMAQNQAAPRPAAPNPAVPNPAVPNRAVQKPAVPPAKAEDLAEQLAMLAFDANPLWSIPARKALSRWVGPMRLFVFGRPEDRSDAQAATRTFGRLAGLAMRVVGEQEVARAQPNVFLVVNEHMAAAFQGPLRGMLRNAFLDDEAAVDAFIWGVVAATPCWTLPVWTDSSRLVLKAAVIGVDATLPREQSRACILRGLGAALGLMGPGAYLPGSAFAPGTAARPTRDDERMLRALYSRALRPGMTRDEAQAAALKVLTARRRPAAKPAAPAP